MRRRRCSAAHRSRPVLPGQEQSDEPHIPSLPIAFAAVATALPAGAPFAKRDDAFASRKVAFTAMSAHFGRVVGMATGKIPFDAKSAADDAEIAIRKSKPRYAGFVEGPKRAARAPSRTPAPRDKFRAAASTMQDETARVNVAARSGNFDAIEAVAGKSCKACHDPAPLTAAPARFA